MLNSYAIHIYIYMYSSQQFSLFFYLDKEEDVSNFTHPPPPPPPPLFARSIFMLRAHPRSKHPYKYFQNCKITVIYSEKRY